MVTNNGKKIYIEDLKAGYGAVEILKSIYLDILPDLSVGEVLFKIKNFIEVNPKKFFKYALHQVVPLSLAIIAINQVGIKPEKKNNAISKKECQHTADWLKNLPLTIIDRRAGDEFVTAGGVETVEPMWRMACEVRGGADVRRERYVMGF